MELSKNYRKTTVSLRNYYRVEPNDNYNAYPITNSAIVTEMNLTILQMIIIMLILQQIPHHLNTKVVLQEKH